MSEPKYTGMVDLVLGSEGVTPCGNAGACPTCLLFQEQPADEDAVAFGRRLYGQVIDAEMTRRFGVRL